MLSFKREAAAGVREPLSSPEAVEAFYSSLPRTDVLVSQGMLSTALAETDCRREPDIHRLRALLALDRSVRSLVERLQSDYFIAAFHSTPREPLLRHSIVELSCSFANAYDGFLRHMREKGADGEWVSLLPRLLVHLFRHREIELFVSSFCYERWPHHRLRQLNAAFQFALAHGLAHEPVVRDKKGRESTRTVTPEQAYLRILLMRLIDTAAMTPRELVLVWQSIAKWSAQATLRRMGSSVPLADEGFVIDLSSSDGLVRAPIATDVTRPVFHLDTTPLLAAIERVFGKTAEAADDSGPVRTSTKTLLARLKRSLAPQAEPIRRRDERADAELTPVEALPGKLTRVFRVLRDEARRQAQGESGFAYSDAVTLGESIAATPVNVEGVQPLVWQVRDYSESGLRLRGRTANSRQLVPGSLILTRNDALWTLSVVRWLRKGVGTNFEVGVERMGDQPQCVVVHPMNDDGEANLEIKERRPALFLQADSGSARRSLVLPAEEYAPGRIVTLLSRTSETTIRLQDPLEVQREFTWASVDILRTRIRLH
jgi:hypothetical protein